MSEYFVDESDSYLTMARIMKGELEKYKKKDVWGKHHTALEEILVEQSFQAGFMAGFEARFFKQNDE